MPNKNRLAYLFEQYLTNNISDSELEELFEYVRDTNRDEALREYVTGVYQNTQAVASVETVDWDTMFFRIINKSTVAAEPERHSVRKFGLWKSIAAVILLAIGTMGAYMYFNKESVPQDIVNAVKEKQDIMPGGNKAVLTLSNGSTINLDSIHNGKLAGQGSINVVKIDSGLLAYKENSGATSSQQNAQEIQYNTLTTPRGGQYQLTLSDGTKVWLNTASSIRYPVAFMGKERKVEIRGEAYFEVVHNKKMPFKVQVGEEMIEDLGTHFNVNAYSDESAMKTTLLEGAIKIKNIVLKPGEQAVIKDGRLNVLKNVDVNNTVAWKNGFFAFNNANLEMIMKKLSRWYDIDVVYEPGVDNDQQRFSGRIGRNLTLSQILNGLKQTRAHFKIEANRKVVILP